MAKEVDISGLSTGAAIQSATPGSAWVTVTQVSGSKYRIEAANNTGSSRSASVTFQSTDNASIVLPVTQEAAPTDPPTPTPTPTPES